MQKLLITGFDAFGGDTLNPSWLAVEKLPEQVGDFLLYKLPISTRFGYAAQQILEAAAGIQPNLILSVGLAGGRDAITPERIAVNIRDARIADNGGFQPMGAYVDPQGPAAYFSTVPVEKMAEAIREARIPASVSNSAGTFVCNDVLYTLLRHYAGTHVRIGFIHVPRTPELGSPSLPLDTIVQGLVQAILVCGNA